MSLRAVHIRAELLEHNDDRKAPAPDRRRDRLPRTAVGRRAEHPPRPGVSRPSAGHPDRSRQPFPLHFGDLLRRSGIGVRRRCVPGIEEKGPRFRLLGAMVVCGGLARVVSLLAVGPPSKGHMFGFAMELGVVPLLMLWQPARALRRTSVCVRYARLRLVIRLRPGIDRRQITRRRARLRSPARTHSPH